MSARRVALVQGGRGSLPGESRLERLVLGEVRGPEELEEPEEAVHVVVERDRGEEEQVPAERGDRRRRAPGGASRVPGRAAQPVGLVHHEEVDARLHRAGGELGPRDERLEGDHRAAVDVEGVEVGAVVADHVGEPGVVEQDEDLVVLPPELAEPLDGERLGGDDEAPLRAPGPDEAAQDEAGLDRLPEADLVGQEPAHGVRGGGALGRVKLVGEQPDAAAEEGAEARGLAQRGEVQGVEAEGEVLDRVDLARGEPLHEVGPGVERAGVARGERQEGRPIGGEAQRLSRGGELHHERPAVDRDHVPDPELRVVAVGEAVARLPHGGAFFHRRRRAVWSESDRRISRHVRRPSGTSGRYGERSADLGNDRPSAGTKVYPLLPGAPVRTARR